MNKEQLLALMAKKKVSGCCLGPLGFSLGHLTDHGLNREEVEAAVDFLLTGIFKLKSSPTDVATAEQFIKSITTAMEA